MSGVCGLTRVQDVRQDGDDAQLTVAAGLLHHLFVDNLNGELRETGVREENAVAAQPGRIQVRTDLHHLGGRGVVGEEIQGPGDDVAAGAPPLVVFGLLAFAEDLDGGESSDLQQPGGREPLLILPICSSRPDSFDVVDSSICFISFIFDFIF